MQRGRGFGNRGFVRGRGRGRGGGRGGMQRIDSATGIPEPPKTPLEDPLVLPFPRLLRKNQRGTLTLDEDLLRAIISLFTVAGTGCLSFSTILEKLRKDYPELMAEIYDSDKHLWAYIRCYSEHFGVDHDPRYPMNVWYLAKCKIVAKADRRRYEREFAAGNIRPIPDPERLMDNARYDLAMEKRAVTFIFAVFRQAIGLGVDYGGYLETKEVATVLRPAYGVPMEVCTYIGDLDDFLCSRNHFFNVFGTQVKTRNPPYQKTVRKMTTVLKNQGRQFDSPRGARIATELEGFYRMFRDPVYFTVDDYKAIEIPELFSYDDFLTFVFQHKLLFHMFTRDNMVELRHDVVPEIDWNEVDSVAPFRCLQEIFAQEQQGSAIASEQPRIYMRATAPPDVVSDDDYEDDYADDDDGIPRGIFTAYDVPPQMPQLPLRPPSPESTATGLTLASGRTRMTDTLTALQGVGIRPGNGSRTNGNAMVSSQNMANTMPAVEHNEPPQARPRIMILGARPPRASARCRPPPSVNRQAHVASGAIPSTNWPGGDGNHASLGAALEDEIEE